MAVNSFSRQFKKYPRGLKIFAIILAIYDLASLVAYLLDTVLILKGETPPFFIFQTMINLPIIIISLWIFLLIRRKVVI